MRIGELLWICLALFILAALCGALVLLIWWLWRKITLPAGAPPPRWADFSALKSGSAKAPVALRLAVIAVLGLIMSAPVGMLYDLIGERTRSYQSVVKELSHSWGGQQLLIGPLMTVPYTIKYKVTEKVPLTEAEIARLRKRGNLSQTKDVTREESQVKTAVLLPEELRITGELVPQERKRGIYSVQVYTADLALSGHFKKPDFTTLDSRVAQVHWDQARILVNLSDTKAFRGISGLTLAEAEYHFVPGTASSPVAPTGFSTGVDLSQAGEKPEFSFSMSVGGSKGFFLAPIAVNSLIDIKSSWPHPKYCGDGLPSSRRQTDEGFQAAWDIPNLVRNYPQFDELTAMAAGGKARGGYQDSDVPQTELRLAEYIVGVDLFEPVFHYSILTRAIKYAMMFIALTFLSVFIYEVGRNGKAAARLHLAQYGIIGLGLCLFYLVLLAASEQMPFTRAYLLAAGLNIAMIAGYVRAALRLNGPALTVAAILIALYAALFFILRMEEYSLASGTSLLVLAMIALMRATRNLGRPAVAEETKKDADEVIDLPPAAMMNQPETTGGES